jgi:hypothetical protein
VPWLARGERRGVTRDAPFLLVGVDAEGEPYESHFSRLRLAVAVAETCSVPNEDGLSWRSWEVWGNCPQTEEWKVLETSESGH